jgi:hypothetical protein
VRKILKAKNDIEVNKKKISHADILKAHYRLLCHLDQQILRKYIPVYWQQEELNGILKIADAMRCEVLSGKINSPPIGLENLKRDLMNCLQEIASKANDK